MTLPGLVGLTALPFCGMLAAVLGFVALARIGRSGGALRGRGLAVGAVILGGLMVVAAPVVVSRAIVGWMTEPLPLADPAGAGHGSVEGGEAPGTAEAVGALGVLGTLVGMVYCFQCVSATAGAANPADLAQGLSQSLVTTWMGAIAFLLGLGASVLAAILGRARSRRFEEAPAVASGQGA